MNITKRILCVLMVALLMFTVAPITDYEWLSFDVSAESEGGFEYEINDEEATVTGYTGADTDVVIPDILGGYPVTEIGIDAFYCCESLESITIPESVTTIDDAAFTGCSGLKSLIIPEGVTSIGSYAFSYCTDIESITVPSTVTVIEDSAFYDCKSIEKVYISDLETWFGIDFASRSSVPLCYGADLYLNDVLLTELTVPDSVTQISDNVFRKCRSIESLIIPGSVVSIGEQAFAYCENLKGITIEDGVTSIGEGAFAYCENLESIALPDSVTEVEDMAFYCCENLESAVLSEGMTDISDELFYYCDNLKSIIIPEGITEIGEGAFEDCRNLVIAHFCGTQEQWDAVEVEEDNEYLTDKIHMATDEDGDGICDLCVSAPEEETTLTEPDSQPTVPDHEHQWYVIRKVFQANCTKIGIKMIGCSICDLVDMQKVDAYGHIDENNDGKCDRCSEVVPTEAPAETTTAKTVVTTTVPTATKAPSTTAKTEEPVVKAKKPAKVKVKKPKSTKKKQIVIIWNAAENANGYQISYSTSKKFMKVSTKTKLVKKAKTTKTTLKKLKSGKKYFIKIRAYKTVDGKKLYGAYSKIMSVKVK